MGLIRRTASQPTQRRTIMSGDQVNHSVNDDAEEEMIDLSVPDEYNEYIHQNVVKPWRDGNPLSE